MNRCRWRYHESEYMALINDWVRMQGILNNVRRRPAPPYTLITVPVRELAAARLPAQRAYPGKPSSSTSLAQESPRCRSNAYEDQLHCQKRRNEAIRTGSKGESYRKMSHG